MSEKYDICPAHETREPCRLILHHHEAGKCIRVFIFKCGEVLSIDNKEEHCCLIDAEEMPPTRVYTDLDHLAGTWTEEQAAEFTEATKDSCSFCGDSGFETSEVQARYGDQGSPCPRGCKPPTPGLRLFQEQAVFLSKIGRELYIKCESVEDAEELYDYLESLATTPLTRSSLNRDFSETVVMRAASDFVEAVQERLSGNQLGFLDLSKFPEDWDFRLMVCCRGETLNGPPGIRRWQLDAVHRLPTHEEIVAGDLPPTKRVHVECMDTPQEAVDEVIRQINAGEHDFSRFGDWPETPGGPEHK